MTLNWINRRSEPILELQLARDGEIKESLQLNPLQESVRIRCEGYHQVFFLEKANYSNERLVFNNAYGLESGVLSFDRYPSLSGVLQLEDQQFFCSHSRKKNTVDIYKSGAPEHHISALLPPEDNMPALYISFPEKRIELDATMLLALCWHLLRTSEYATAETAYRPERVQLQTTQYNVYR